MYKGSCLCGKVTYEVSAEPAKVSNCHCSMCQKQHGAAFATYASVRIDKFKYLSGESDLVEFNSSSTIKRKFCGNCGSSIEWSGCTQYPNWVSIAVGTFDSEFNPAKISEIHCCTKKSWLNN